MKKWLFGSARIDSLAANLGLLALRVFAGGALMWAHGLGKMPPSEGFVRGVTNLGFPMPVAFAWSAGLAETVGGLLLAVGLATRPAAVLVTINMAVAAFLQHASDPFGRKELALFYFFVGVLFATTGGGRFSLDRFFRKS